MLESTASRLRKGNERGAASQQQPRDKEDQRPVSNALSLEQGWRLSVGYYSHQHTHPEESHGDGLISI